MLSKYEDVFRASQKQPCFLWTVNLNQAGKPGAISVKALSLFKKTVLINNSTFYTLDPGHVQPHWCESGVGESKTATMHSKATNDNLTPKSKLGQGFHSLAMFAI